MEHTAPSFVLVVNAEPAALDPVILEELLQTQRDGKFCQQQHESVG